MTLVGTEARSPEMNVPPAPPPEIGETAVAARDAGSEDAGTAAATALTVGGGEPKAPALPPATPPSGGGTEVRDAGSATPPAPAPKSKKKGGASPKAAPSPSRTPASGVSSEGRGT